MTTQIMFKIDDKLKKAVQKRAKEEGISLSDIFKFAAKSYANNKLSIDLVEEESWEDFTPDSRINFEKGLADIRAGRFKRSR